MMKTCSVCGGGHLTHESRDLPYEYKGSKTTLRGIVGEYCNSCGEIIFTPEESNAFSAQASAFRTAVNAESFDPTLFTRVRKNLRIDQQQAGMLFGGGVNAFSRYETGKTTPPIAVVKLFKMFDKFPELFEEYKSL
ncbi:type II TA system antitoxin MqsA family protein [Atlantibacter hermannii]|uniref:type II TA system antitoxin MqsA family protein n=1 Tax=Atlantibacter hermannii TaxID=565 RepID=UPI001FD5C0C8|nr:type II TA system antitoxin MqsA family protein [Atlantibacter hermannii]